MPLPAAHASNAEPIDLPLAVQLVPIQTIRDQGFVRLGDAVRDVSGVVRKKAYFGLIDSFGIRGFDASTRVFNGSATTTTAVGSTWRTCSRLR